MDGLLRRAEGLDDDPSETTEEILKVQEYARRRYKELFPNHHSNVTG
jgi:hypothetical protein